MLHLLNTGQGEMPLTVAEIDKQTACCFWNGVGKDHSYWWQNYRRIQCFMINGVYMIIRLTKLQDKKDMKALRCYMLYTIHVDDDVKISNHNQ